MQPDEDLTRTILVSDLILNSRYRILRELGRGGFGRVYLARDQQLENRPVVIKTLLDQRKDDPWFEKKFADEVKALARIDHPGVVGVLDRGTCPDGTPFLVMQYVEGMTLRAEMKRGRLALPRIGRIVRQASRALGAAHDKGVWHLDLKPENVMLQQGSGGEEFVKLIDFGIAKVRSDTETMSITGARRAGTPLYMAPEQFDGKPAASSDIYALGLIAYEMIAGRRAFVYTSLPDLFAAQQQESIPSPRQFNLALPFEAEEAVVKALRYRPEDRFQNAREFGDALARALEHAIEKSDEILSPPPAPRSSRWKWVATAALLLCVAGGFVAYQSGFWNTPAVKKPLNDQPPPVIQEQPKAPPKAEQVATPVAPAPAASAPQETTQKPWKDSVEHDLYDAIAKERDPKARLEKLEQWQKQYPDTAYLKERRSMLLTAYVGLGQPVNAVNVAKEILGDDPADFAALYYTAYFGRDRSVTGWPNPSPEVLDRIEKAADAVVAVTVIRKPPPNFTEDWWNANRSSLENIAHMTLGWIAAQRKNWDAAESEYRNCLQINPNDSQAAYQFASALVAQKKPEKQPLALFYFARAAVYDGPGSLPAQTRKQVMAYLENAYKTYHGSTDGLDDLLEQAKLQATPPADFKLKPTVAQPSFNCANARTPTEKLICSDTSLAALERSMAAAHHQALLNLSSDEKAAFVREHDSWFREYSRTCNALPADSERRDCIVRYLSNRTQQLTHVRQKP